MSREQSVRGMRQEIADGRWRVTADVAGKSIWFESGDIELSPVPEAFGSAFLIPMLHQTARMHIGAHVSREWTENINAMLPILSEWWGYPQLLPRGSANSAPTEAKSESAEAGALFFTGGVDSFYSLLRGDISASLLVFIHGYDMKVEDNARLAAFRPSLEAAAGETGARAVVLRTNLREHPLFEACSWERTHGGALAAVGHLLSGGISRLAIAATLVKEDERAWGSHRRIDHLWSSDRLRIAQSGSEIWRHDKLREMVDEPLVREHLRVCWENRRPTGNCSNCDKCLMTMVVLLQAGKLERFPGFDGGAASRYEGELARRLDELLKTTYVRTFATLLADGLDSKLAAAVRRLLDRSLRPTTKKSRFRFWRRNW